MTTTTSADIALTDDWTELTDLANDAVDLQNVGTTPVAVVFGGASAPTGKTGTLLGYRERVTGTSANVWARSVGGSSKLSVQVTT